MKRVSKLLTGIVAGLVLAALTTTAFAEKGKEKTITGEAKCAKCALKEGSKCQTVIQTEAKDGKKVTYYLVNNDVAKAFHDKGDWCDKHDRAKSQCFICDPGLREKFAAEYRAKYGKEPPEPTGNMPEKK